MRRRTEAAGHSEELSTLLGRLPALASSRGRLATINGFLASAVDGRLVLLRERIAPLGLRIRSVRARGFLLEVGPIGSG